MGDEANAERRAKDLQSIWCGITHKPHCEHVHIFMFTYHTAVGLKLPKHSQRKGSVALFYKANVHPNHLSVNLYLSVTVNEGTQVQPVTRFVHIIR